MLANKTTPIQRESPPPGRFSTLYSKISSGPNFRTFSPLFLAVIYTLEKKPVRKHLCACSLVAAATAAFLVVACSSPTPPRGVTVVNNFDAKRYLGTGMRLPVLITALNVDWKKSPQHTACVMTAA